MNVRTFCAPSVDEALALVRRALGPDAVILSTRETPLSIESRFEVTAAVERSGGAIPGAEVHSSSRGALRPDIPVGTPLERSLRLRHPGSAGSRRPREEERTSAPGIERLLLDCEVDAVLAASLGSRLASHRAPLNGLAEFLRQIVKPSPAPSADGVTVLIGGTGAGKTTTLFKLAAGPVASLRPALVTCDTWRIAAVEQLAVFAEWIEAPFAAAYSPEELAHEVERFRDSGHHVLVDTPGRSPRDPAGMEQLGRFVSAVPGRSVHLVIPASVKAKDVEALCAASEPLGVDHLLFSKLDESASRGPLLTALVRARRPVSWVTFGQDVPADLASARDFDPVRLLLDGESDVRSARKSA